MKRLLDRVIRDCGNIGFLPLVVDVETGDELYRGEHQETTGLALQRCQWAIDRMQEGE